MPTWREKASLALRRAMLFTALLLAVASLAVASLAVASGSGPDSATGPLVYNIKGSVMFLDGKGGPPRKLGKGYQPCLSPDASKAAWVAANDDPDKARLIVCDPASGKTSDLLKTSGFLTAPRWSPDGNALVYVRMTSEGLGELWLLKGDSPPERLAQAGQEAGDAFFEPMWAPDGACILYHDMRRLYRISPAGNLLSQTALTDITGGPANAVTSADRFAQRPGETGEILFTAAVPGTETFRNKVPDMSSALFLFDPRAKTSARLTPETLTAFGPAWTPDGGHIVFTGYDDLNAGAAYPFKVWTMRPGGAPTTLAPGEDPMPPSGR